MASQERLLSEINNKYADYKFRSRLLAIALVTILGFAIAQNSYASVSAAAITLVKAIVSSSINLGLDKAGKAWMPNHWSDFKALVMSPLIKSYPDLVSDEFETIETRKQAAREALLALDNDKDLQFAILTRLKNLEYGQEEIWDKVQILSLWLADHESRITRIESILGIPGYYQKMPDPPNVADESFSIHFGSEGSATLVEYSSIVRKLLQAARHGFRDIVKGKPYERNQYLKDIYNPTLTLPGAEHCHVGIPTQESFSKSSFYHCTLMQSAKGYMILRGVQLTENEAKKYPQAESWLQDAVKNLEPRQIYVSPPGMTIPTWEEALLTYLDTITRIRNALPPYWEEELPEFWESLKEPRNWNGYKLKMRENPAYYYKRDKKRAPPANWDSYNVSSRYEAKSTDGRSVRVYFSSMGPMEGQKMPRNFYITVNFVSQD